MEVKFASKAITHLDYWKKSGNKAVQKKINQLIEAIQKDHITGLGNQNL